MARNTLTDRFMAKVSKADDGCWRWVGHARPDGYGLIWKDGRAQRANRVSFELFNGPLEPGQVVCHRCDNPSCVNPDHLFSGTRLENNRDAVIKDRHPRGERNGQSRLSVDDVLAIRSMRGTPQATIARQFKIHQSTVSDIWTGRRWKYLRAGA